jgi:hypothetical protein
MRPLEPLVLCLAIAVAPLAFAQATPPADAPTPAPAHDHAAEHGDHATDQPAHADGQPDEHCDRMHAEMHDGKHGEPGEHGEMHDHMHAAGDAAADHAAHRTDTAAPVDHAAHHPAPPAAAGAASAQAARFATDTVLREQMAGIHTAVAELGHLEMGHMGADQARVFAEAIESRIRTIIAECKLPPDADAALHAVIVPLLDRALALKATPTDATPVAAMRTALAEYARRFDDPGFAAAH